MKHWRPGSVYLSQKTLARRFALERALQHDQHSPDREVSGDRTLVKLRPRQRMHGAVQRGPETLIHRRLGGVDG